MRRGIALGAQVVETLFLPALLLLGSASASAQEFSFKDPKGDDKGPGTYTYPTDGVYTPGSFDLTGITFKDKGASIEIKIDVATRIEDPWESKSWGGNGFSVQFVQIYLDLDHKEGSGQTRSLPGINVLFSSAEAWDKVILVSPQGKTRLQAEIDTKAAAVKKSIVIPTVTRAQGISLLVVVDKKDLEGFGPGFGFQALMNSNEGYPAETDLLTRKVNEYGGDHRFGGGSDFDCDPHVLDLFVGPGKGEETEKASQFEALKKFTCTDDETKNTQTTVPMIYTAAAATPQAPAPQAPAPK